MIKFIKKEGITLGENRKKCFRFDAKTSMGGSLSAENFKDAEDEVEEKILETWGWYDNSIDITIEEL